MSTRLLADARRLGQKDERALGLAVGAVAGTGAKNVRERFANGRHRGYWLPPLELALQNWERYLGRTVAWPDDISTWAVEDVPMRADEPTPF